MNDYREVFPAAPPKPGSSSVVIVDDDQEVLSSLALFLELDTDYQVLTFKSPREALAMLQQREVDLVISDYLMPEMDGLEFLGKVKQLYPSTGRILLTGYSDKQNAIKAINEVGLFQYMEKPWDNDQFKMVIRNALSHKDLTESLTAKIQDLDVMLRQRDTLAETQRALKQELALARKLQERTLPQVFPKVEGLSFSVKYCPALDVGGDFYDIMPLSDGRFGVLIADITGHGIQAALSTTLLKFAFRNFEDAEVDASEILTGMNSALFRTLPEEVFVAALVLIIQPLALRCSLVNGGIPYPICLRGPSRRMESLSAHGLVLGAVASGVYSPGEPRDFDLLPGDALILYTDGLTEAENGAGEQFGFQEMRRLFEQQRRAPLPDLIGSLIGAAKAFAEQTAQFDDITVLAIEHLPERTKAR